MRRATTTGGAGAPERSQGQLRSRPAPSNQGYSLERCVTAIGLDERSSPSRNVTRIERDRARHLDRHLEQQLRHALAERIEASRRRAAAVERLVQDEVHGVDPGQMKALD